MSAKDDNPKGPSALKVLPPKALPKPAFPPRPPVTGPKKAEGTPGKHRVGLFRLEEDPTLTPVEKARPQTLEDELLGEDEERSFENTVVSSLRSEEDGTVSDHSDQSAFVNDDESGIDAEHIFFQREAQAAADRLPEHAALMWLEAAAAADRAGVEQELVLAAVDRAVGSRSQTPWVMSLARRVFMRYGEYERALQLCLEEAKLGGDNVTRVAVLMEAATLQRFFRHNPQEALESLVEARKIAPVHVPALLAAMPLQEELQLFGDQAETLRQLGGALADPKERALFLFGAATVHETRLGQAQEAETLYRRAVDADPLNLPALLSLGFLYERRKSWGQYCQCLRLQSQLVTDASLKARLLHQAGSLQLDLTGDLEAASRDLRQATEVVPESPSSWQRLADVYEAEGRNQDLVNALKELLHFTLDSQRRAALLAHIAWLHEVRLGAVDEAITGYREALQAMPGYLPAIQALSSIYYNVGDYESLLQVSGTEIDGSLPPRVRAVRCLELGDILALKLNKREEAAQLFRRALELDPDLYLAFAKLKKVLLDLQSYPELADALRVQARRRTDRNTRTALEIKIAHLVAGPLKDLEKASSQLEGIKEGDLQVYLCHELLELYERSGKFTEMVSCLLTLAAKTQDPVEAHGYRLQAATLLEHVLEEPDRAIEICHQVLLEDPPCAAAVRNLARMFQRLEKWGALVDLLRHELKTEPKRSDAAILFCRMGRLLEDNLGRAGEAIEAYGMALEREPTCVPALIALERLVRKEKKWNELVKVLLKYTEARMDAFSVSDAVFRAAEVKHYHLQDLPGATDLYLQALEKDSEFRAANLGLLHALVAQEKWPEAVALLETLAKSTTSTEERGILVLLLARMREHCLLERPNVELYRLAMGSLATGGRLRAEMTRVLREGPASPLAKWIFETGQQASDGGLAAGYLLECAALAEFDGQAEMNPLEAAVEAFARNPELPEVIWCLERALWRAERWAELGKVREQDALAERKPVVRIAKLASAANAYLRGGAKEDARRVAGLCLETDKKCLAALRVSATVAAADENWPELAQLCERIAAGCGHARNGLEWQLRAADLWADQLGDPERALTNLSAIMAKGPIVAEAFHRAERLLRLQGDLRGLSRLYRRRLAEGEDTPAKIELLRQHARLLRDELQDATGAVSELTRLLAINPADVEALSEAAALLMKLERWSAAAAYLETLVALSVEPQERYMALMWQAEIWLHRVPELDRAREILAATLREFPCDGPAQRLMVDLHRAEGNWTQAEARLLEIAAQQDINTQIWAKMELADVARLGLRDEARQNAYEMEALELSASNYQTMAGLVEQYRSRKALDRFVALAESFVARCSDRNRTLTVLLTVARLLLEELSHPALAVPLLQQALQLSPADEEIRLFHARALEKAGDDAAAAQELRAVFQHNMTCAAAYRSWARIMDRSGHREGAVAARTLAALFGEPTGEEIDLLQRLQAPALPQGVIEPTFLALPEELSRIHLVFELAVPHLGSVFPAQVSERLEEGHPVVEMCRCLAAAAGLSALTVFAGGERGATVALGSPSTLVISPEVCRFQGNAVFRFWVGRALAVLASQTALLDGIPGVNGAEVLNALCDPNPASAEAVSLRKKIFKALPRKVRKQLQGLHPPVTYEQWEVWRTIEQRRADQIGLLMSGNPRDAILEVARIENVAFKDVSRSRRISSMIQFVISDAYSRAIRVLWAGHDAVISGG